jgi:hypothetical protein
MATLLAEPPRPRPRKHHVISKHFGWRKPSRPGRPTPGIFRLADRNSTCSRCSKWCAPRQGNSGSVEPQSFLTGKEPEDRILHKSSRHAAHTPAHGKEDCHKRARRYVAGSRGRAGLRPEPGRIRSRQRAVAADSRKPLEEGHMTPPAPDCNTSVAPAARLPAPESRLPLLRLFPRSQK